MKNQPNIILIMSDDLGYEVIGANGGTSYNTPKLDEMAKNGMRFENAHVMPLCTPTRISLMTGKYTFAITLDLVYSPQMRPLLGI